MDRQLLNVEPVKGKVYPSRRVTVEPARVAAFADAVGADPQAGPPLTFAAVYALFPSFTQLIEDREAGIDMGMLVHSEQEFEWSRQPEVGDVLEVTGEVIEDVRRRGMRFVTMLAVCRNEQGEEICRSRMVCVIRARG